MKHLVNHFFLPLLILSFTALIVSACSPTAQQTAGSEANPAADYMGRGMGETTNSSTDIRPGTSGTTVSESEEAPKAVAVNRTTSAYDANGIEVGYTEEGRPYRGNPDASIIIHEYSDFQCPYCVRFTQQTMPDLLQNQIVNGEAVLVFYDYPLTSIHPQALAAANAARCAGEQGAVLYWEMHDALFRNTNEWANDRAEEVFSQYASELDLDLTQFNACQSDDRYHDEILASVDYGTSLGISSTPSFFINEQPLIGAQPIEVFNQVITAVQNGEEVVAAQPEPTADPALAPTPASIDTSNIAAALGNPEAPVKIVEFTDYQCPYCARHATETLPQITSEMIDSGRVYYMVKDFPLESIHPQARLGAIAARCAGEQDAYWEMHEALFADQQTWSSQGAEGAHAALADIAVSLGLNTDAFDTCLNSGKFDAVIDNNLQEGVQLGIRGTPGFFIDGFPVSGAQPYDLFDYAVGLAEEGTLASAYTRSPDPTPVPAPSGPVDISIEGAYALGDPNAPVTIIEFTDYQCPYCSRHHLQTYPQIKSDYIDKGLVYYVFKEFPLTNIHPQAFAAAEAARCAGDQDAYTAMHDTLFANQQEWAGQSNTTPIFVGYAAELGLDTDTFSACLESHAQETAVYADMSTGADLGISGTPAFFINGYFLNGAQPYSTFQEAINHFLSQ